MLPLPHWKHFGWVGSFPRGICINISTRKRAMRHHPPLKVNQAGNMCKASASWWVEVKTKGDSVSSERHLHMELKYAEPIRAMLLAYRCYWQPGTSSVTNTNWLKNIVGYLIGWVAKANFKSVGVLSVQQGACAEPCMHSGVCAPHWLIHTPSPREQTKQCRITQDRFKQTQALPATYLKNAAKIHARSWK